MRRKCCVHTKILNDIHLILILFTRNYTLNIFHFIQSIFVYRDVYLMLHEVPVYVIIYCFLWTVHGFDVYKSLRLSQTIYRSTDNAKEYAVYRSCEISYKFPNGSLCIHSFDHMLAVPRGLYHTKLSCHSNAHCPQTCLR